jgi:hypothetical protein
MKKLTTARQFVQAIRVVQEERTAYPPNAVAVILGDDTVVVTPHETRSSAEKTLVRTLEGAVQVNTNHGARRLAVWSLLDSTLAGASGSHEPEPIRGSD